MTTLPAPTPGVVGTPVGGDGVLFDPVLGELHELNATGWMVWQACEIGEGEDALVHRLASGAPIGQVRVAVRAYLDQLHGAGLLGGRPSGPLPTTRPPVVARRGLRYRVLADLVQVHIAVDRPVGTRLAADVRRLLAPMVDVGEPTVELRIERTDAGFLLAGPTSREAFASAAELLDNLPTALNRIAESSPTCLALHAGAVRAPSGQLVVLPAVSGAGKSTLTARLVQAGWRYVTDEAVGIEPGSGGVLPYAKPLALDATSRAVLGLAPSTRADAALWELGGHVVSASLGRPDCVVLPTYVPAEPASVEVIEPEAAVAAIGEHALNLRLLGRTGLDALVDLVRTTPVMRVRHPGGAAAIDVMASLVGDLPASAAAA